MTTSIPQRIAEELGVRERQVAAAVELLDGGATVPFIARYRKEVDRRRSTTPSCARSRSGCATCGSWRSGAPRPGVDPRRRASSTTRCEAQILAADSKARLEDIYLPYKPKRRTKAQIAREAGLEPLADLLLADPTRDPQAAAAAFVDADKGVADAAAALDGARAILVERFAEDADLIGELRERMWTRGRLVARSARARRRRARSSPTTSTSPSRSPKLPSHRILAMFRGEKEEVLDLTLEPEPPSEPGARSRPTRRAIARRFGIADHGRPGDQWLADTVRWAWRTRILVHLGIDLRLRLWQAAEDEAVRVFAANLRDLLLAAPAGTPRHDGPGPGLPHRREGRRRRRHRQGRRHRHDLPARAAATGGTSRCATLARAGARARAST